MNFNCSNFLFDIRSLNLNLHHLIKKFPAFLEVTISVSKEYCFHIATSFVILCYIFVL